MPTVFTYLLILSAGVFAAILLIEVIVSGGLIKVIAQTLVLGIAVVVLHWTTGFPRSTRIVMFGGTSPIIAIAIMFACILLGMVAHYVFYLEKTSFSWLALIKPLAVSPIVLIPLIGSIQANATLEPIQLISIAILAFQNGFFWEAVFADAGKQR
jgi:hypothetical protein